MKTVSTALSLVAISALSIFGCGEREGSFIPKNTKEAASHLENVFSDADPEMQKNAQVAAEALRSEQYEKAAAAILSFNQYETVSYEQAMAVKNSAANLQEALAYRIQDDPNARRAWEMLKNSARDR